MLSNVWRWEAMAEVYGTLSPLEVGVELGVKEGRFTSAMLARFPMLTMHAVDLWEQRPGHAETYEEWDFVSIRAQFDQATLPHQDRLRVLRMDTAEAARGFTDGSIDFVFIDADHSYAGVKNDIAAWRGKVRQGGVVSGHDYCASFPGVMRAVDEAFGAGVVTPGSNDTWWVRRGSI